VLGTLMLIVAVRLVRGCGRGRYLRVDRVGFQNLTAACEQRFQAAGSYWLISPPRIGRRRILP